MEFDFKLDLNSTHSPSSLVQVLLGDNTGVQFQVERVGPVSPNTARDSHVFSLPPLLPWRSPAKECFWIRKVRSRSLSFTDLSRHKEQVVSVDVCKDCSELLGNLVDSTESTN